MVPSKGKYDVDGGGGWDGRDEWDQPTSDGGLDIAMLDV